LLALSGRMLSSTVMRSSRIGHQRGGTVGGSVARSLDATTMRSSDTVHACSIVIESTPRISVPKNGQVEHPSKMISCICVAPRALALDTDDLIPAAA
jgi:hypothetical protein